MNDRSALQQLVLQRCFLHADSFAPIPASDAAAPWYFYGCGLTLQHDGLLLAADVLLEELDRFASVQIATYGLAALPLLGAMIARSPRPLTGLFVRKEAKSYGLRRLVEGDGDRAQPVVFDDLGKSRESPPETARRPAPARADARVPDGLSPADAVRFCAGIAPGGLPHAPQRFDADYDAAGGFHVSVRSDEDGARLAMVTAGASGADEFPAKLVLAGARAIASARAAGAELERCTVAVTLIGADAPAR